MAGVPVAFSEVLNVSGVVQFLVFEGCFDVFVFLCVCAYERVQLDNTEVRYVDIAAQKESGRLFLFAGRIIMNQQNWPAVNREQHLTLCRGSFLWPRP